MKISEIEKALKDSDDDKDSYKTQADLFDKILASENYYEFLWRSYEKLDHDKRIFMWRTNLIRECPDDAMKSAMVQEFRRDLISEEWASTNEY